MRQKKLILLTALAIAGAVCLMGCGSQKSEETSVEDTVSAVNVEVETETEEIKAEKEFAEATIHVQTEEEKEAAEHEAEDMKTKDKTLEQMEKESETVLGEYEDRMSRDVWAEVDGEPMEEIEFTVVDKEMTKYATAALNIRKGPNIRYSKFDAYSFNEEAKITGETDNGWYRVEKDGQVGYINAKYVADEKVEITTANPGSTSLDGLVIEDGVSADCRNTAISLYSYVPQSVKNAIVNTGYKVLVTTDPYWTEGHCGSFYQYGWPYADGRDHLIASYAKSVNAVNISVLHEIGHFIDNYVGDRDGYGYSELFQYRAVTSSQEFRDIYDAERGQSGFPGYATDCREDYFAEAYWKALTKPQWCQSTIPRTYEYVINISNSI